MPSQTNQTGQMDQTGGDPQPASLPDPELLSVGDGEQLLYMLGQRGDVPVAILQLVAARSGEGTSTLARDLALIAARKLSLRTLILDVDPPGHRQSDVLRRLSAEMGAAVDGPRWLGGADSPPPPRVISIGKNFVARRIGPLALFVTEMVAPTAPSPTGTEWAAILEALRSNFDLVVVDSPALERSYDAVMLAPYVDTTLLVVEAEATRAAVALNLRDRILEVGGAIAGAILNKRRFHIPRSIYRRL
ncbi:MAG TPA: hypothetical protein VNT30_25760 [Stellaceae bacterium]|nr:hypothetical protein [Stellaceae bacterium]